MACEIERERECVCVIMCECCAKLLADYIVLQKKNSRENDNRQNDYKQNDVLPSSASIHGKKFPNLFLYSDKVLSKFHSMQ